MTLDILQLPLLPLVVIHAAHNLRKDLSERPRFASVPDAARLSISAQILLGLWFTINMAPVGYYALECLRYWLELLA